MFVLMVAWKSQFYPYQNLSAKNFIDYLKKQAKNQAKVIQQADYEI